MNLQIANDTTLYLLSSDALYKCSLNQGNIQRHSIERKAFEKGYSRGWYTEIQFNKKEEPVLVHFFANDPSREPKIDLWNTVSNQHYLNFVTTDPYNICANYNLVAYSKGKWIVAYDNLSDSILVLDHSFSPIGYKRIFQSYTNSTRLKEAIRSAEHRYMAFNEEEDLDKLMLFTDTNEHISKILALSQDRFVLCGIFRRNDSILPFTRLYALDSALNFKLETEIDLFYPQGRMKDKIDYSNFGLNLIGRRTATNGDLIAAIDHYVPITPETTYIEYQSARSKSTKYALIVYSVRY